MPNPPDLSQASDHDIVARARKGDAAAQREIVRRYAATVYDRIFRMVGHHEPAEDLRPETLVRAFHAIDRDRPQGKPFAWMFPIA
jgi:RNA polymerase sigma-70 factor (ECF subfamily)